MSAKKKKGGRDKNDATGRLTERFASLLTKSLERLVDAFDEMLSGQATIVGSLSSHSEEDLGGEDDAGRRKRDRVEKEGLRFF